MSIVGKGWIALIFSSVFAGLGNSLEPVSTLAWLSIVSLIFGFDHVLSSFHHLHGIKWWFQFLMLILATVVTQALGSCLGFSSVFGFPETTSATIFLAFLYGLLIGSMTVVLCLVPHFFFQQRYPSSWAKVFVFPSSHTVLFHLIIGRSLGTFIALANATLDYMPLRQFSSLFGLTGIHYVITYTATVSAMFLLEQHSSTLMYRISKYTLAALIIIFIITGFFVYADDFYQTNVSELVVETIPVSCLVTQYARYKSNDWENTWNRIEARMNAGDRIILTSEEAFSIQSSEEEDVFLTKAKETMLRLAVATDKTVFLGIGYRKTTETISTNQFVLFAPNGDIAWNYRKAHPVPSVEDEITAGPNDLPIYDSKSEFGILGGAICFDLDYPSFIHQAGKKKVNLLLQPSWTWNAISSRHFEANAVRAIENGFTLFRCSSNGESGIIGPRGKVHQRQFSGNNVLEEHVFSLPLNIRVTTFFTLVGFIFEWFCLTFTILLYSSLIIPREVFVGLKRIPFAARFRPRRNITATSNSGVVKHETFEKDAQAYGSIEPP